jgi:hypothetical protein
MIMNFADTLSEKVQSTLPIELQIRGAHLYD